jgi:hypothetical protein
LRRRALFDRDASGSKPYLIRILADQANQLVADNQTRDWDAMT